MVTSSYTLAEYRTWADIEGAASIDKLNFVLQLAK